MKPQTLNTIFLTISLIGMAAFLSVILIKEATDHNHFTICVAGVLLLCLAAVHYRARIVGCCKKRRWGENP